jgi:serine/threonine protein kinase
MTEEIASSTGGRYASIGKYQVRGHIATGGMGAVYRAMDVDTGREVALKVLPPDLASRPAVLERFRREARHGLKLRHENIVTLYEFGEAEGIFYLAMEFVDGIDLQQLIDRSGPLDPTEACEMLFQVTCALDHAYQAGIIHRDIKPSNILLTRQENRRVAKLTDLGLALQARDEEFRLTRDGNTVGTVDYLSPEQARDSRAVDIRSDIYSLGCTWFHMLAGVAPFPEGSLPERIFKHAEAEPPDVRQFNRRVTPGQVAILQRMLAKKPEDRYQTPAELLKDLGWELGQLAPEAHAAPTQLAASRGGPDDSEDTPSPMPAGSASVSSSQARVGASDDVPASGSCVAGHTAQPGSAVRQFETATQFLAAGNLRAAITLLRVCCRLEPANLTYRDTLREAQQAQHDNNHTARWLGRLTSLPAKIRLRFAHRAGNQGKVLDLGEQILGQDPGSLATHLLMARAAEGLGLTALAVWLLKQARREDSGQIIINRALALCYERHDDLKHAVSAWKCVCRAAPDDVEAHRKVKDLLARATIARGNYEGILALGHEQQPRKPTRD